MNMTKEEFVSKLLKAQEEKKKETKREVDNYFYSSWKKSMDYTRRYNRGRNVK